MGEASEPKPRANPTHGVKSDETNYKYREWGNALGDKLKHVFEKHNVLIAYLFGSRARGQAREDSDYDIAVLFENPNTTILNEIELGMDIATNLNVPPDKVDIVLLNNADALLKARIFKEGIPIYAKDEKIRRMWERRAYVEILDELDLQALYIRRVLSKKLKPSNNPKNF